MDYTKIPYFASIRQAGTVIVRQKMEVSDACCMPRACPVSDWPRVVRRPPGCEACCRTRIVNQYSDCDSGTVDRSRPYRSSAARSRYVNVCAAVCLVILVGGLSPQSSAAPHKRSTMDQQPRDTNTEENSLWANPCDYDSNPQSDIQYSPNKAKEIMRQARSAYESSLQYKDKLAMQLHSMNSFEHLLTYWTNDDYLRQVPGMEDVLPKTKVLYEAMSQEFMNDLMTKIDTVLPQMYKGLKMIVAGLHTVSSKGLNDGVASKDASLKQNITETMHNVRAVLCLFNELMRSRKLEILKLTNDEVPKIQQDQVSFVLLVYRDTLNYLEYLAQVFEKMYEVNPPLVAN